MLGEGRFILEEGKFMLRGRGSCWRGGGGLCWGRVGFILEEGKVLGSCWRWEILI